MVYSVSLFLICDILHYYRMVLIYLLHFVHLKRITYSVSLFLICDILHYYRMVLIYLLHFVHLKRITYSISLFLIRDILHYYKIIIQVNCDLKSNKKLKDIRKLLLKFASYLFWQ